MYDNKLKIKKGDSVTIKVQGIKVTGEVLSADHWGEKDGWYIEMTNANVSGGYSYWKQGQDGGEIINHLEKADGKRLDLETWKNVFRNVKEIVEEQKKNGEEVESDWIEVVWLDGIDEWCLCHGEELFEDGFKSEQEAQECLNYLEKLIL